MGNIGASVDLAESSWIVSLPGFELTIYSLQSLRTHLVGMLLAAGLLSDKFTLYCPS